MVAAVITKVIQSKELTGNAWEENVKVYITTSGDWFLSKFATIDNVQICDVGTTGAFVSAISANKITISANATDWVHLRIVGH